MGTCQAGHYSYGGHGNVDLPTLIEVGIAAGYITEEENAEIGLTRKGWDWWNRDYKKRG
jgi:hypothetical protein